WGAARAGLTATLSFLSEDEYDFEFVPLKEEEPLQGFFRFPAAPGGAAAEEVLMFSGGLDSLGGAVQEAAVDRRTVVLVHHRPTQKLARRQARLLGLLGEHAGAAAPVYFPVRVNKKKRLGREPTQRTRSFLYAALGATVAALLGLSRLRFYENGV